MKPNLKWALALAWVGLSTATSVFAADLKEIDFERLNPVLQNLVDTVVAGDELVEFARPRFDAAFCDFGHERLKYDLDGALADTPWLSGGRASVSASSTYQGVRSGNTGIRVALAVQTRTDSIALARYASKLGLQKNRNYSPKFAARIVGELQRLSQVSSLTELAQLVTEGQGLAIEILDDKISGLDASEAADFRKLKQAYESTRVTVETHAGKATRILVSNADASGFLVRRPELRVQPGLVWVSVADSGIDSRIEAFARVEAAQLDDLRLKLKTKLLGAQQGDSQELGEIEGRYRQALIEFKSAVKGQNHY